MGNCCSEQHRSSSSSSSVNWGGDDWGSVTSKRRRKTILFEEGGGEGNALTSSSSCNGEIRQKLLGSFSSSSSGSSSASSSSSISVDGAIPSNNPLHGEIKIKISKKELEKIMEAMDTEQQGLNVNQVLSRLMMKADMTGYHEYHEMGHHQHSWRPVLQSIPEVN